MACSDALFYSNLRAHVRTLLCAIASILRGRSHVVLPEQSTHARNAVFLRQPDCILQFLINLSHPRSRWQRHYESSKTVSVDLPIHIIVRLIVVVRIPYGATQASEYLLKLVQMKYPTFPTRLTAVQSNVSAGNLHSGNSR